MAEDIGKQREATIRDFLNVVFKRKYVILSIVAVTTASVFYLKAMQPQSYVSGSRILVKRGERTTVFAGRPTYLGWAEEVSSQIEVILSKPVFDRAERIFADSVAVRGLPGTMRFNAGSVRAEVVGESNVFTISYAGVDPIECELGCAAATFAYQQYYRERSAPPEVSDYFSSEIRTALEELDYWRKKKSEFLSRERYVGIDEESQIQTFKLGRLELDLAEVDGELSSLALQVEAVRALAQLPPDELENRLAVSTTRNDLQTAIMREIKSKLQNLRLGREGLLRKYTANHPEVVSVEKQIRDLQAELKQEVMNAYNVAKSVYDATMAKRKLINREVESTKMALNAIPNKQAALSRIENKIESFQTRYETLLKRQSEAEIAVASSPAWDVTILSPASKASPSKTKDYVRMALGPFLALIVGLGIAFFLESLDHSLKNIGEVEEYLDVRVLATFADAGRGRR